MQYVSDGCLDLTGYMPESLMNNKDQSFSDIIAPEYRDMLWRKSERDLENALSFRYEYEILTASGTRKWVMELGQGIYDEWGKVEALEGIIVDISDRKAFETTLKYNSEHDSWTGLRNRNCLEEMLNRDAMAVLAEKRAVVSINLSAIQSLTSTYGFHYTQDLIRNVVQILDQRCTEKRMLINTFENRFAFYVRAYHDTAELRAFCTEIAESLEPVISIEGIGGGIGVVEIHNDRALDADQILKNLLNISEMAVELNDPDLGVCFYEA